jgi:hypothetical protein
MASRRVVWARLPVVDPDGLVALEPRPMMRRRMRAADRLTEEITSRKQRIRDLGSQWYPDARLGPAGELARAVHPRAGPLAAPGPAGQARIIDVLTEERDAACTDACDRPPGRRSQQLARSLPGVPAIGGAGADRGLRRGSVAPDSVARCHAKSQGRLPRATDVPSRPRCHQMLGGPIATTIVTKDRVADTLHWCLLFLLVCHGCAMHRFIDADGGATTACIAAGQSIYSHTCRLMMSCELVMTRSRRRVPWKRT